MQFWQKLCAGDDLQEQWLQLSLAATAPRAAWIIHATRPKNFEQGKPLPSTPQFETNRPLKDGAFRPLKTHLLPDRFVVRLYKGGDRVQRVYRKIFLNRFYLDWILQMIRLIIILHPGYLIMELVFKPPITSTGFHNFEAAENAGRLQNRPGQLEYQDGIDKIVVLGTKLSVDETDGWGYCLPGNWKITCTGRTV